MIFPPRSPRQACPQQNLVHENGDAKRYPWKIHFRPISQIFPGIFTGVEFMHKKGYAVCKRRYKNEKKIFCQNCEIFCIGFEDQRIFVSVAYFILQKRPTESNLGPVPSISAGPAEIPQAESASSFAPPAVEQVFPTGAPLEENVPTTQNDPPSNIPEIPIVDLEDRLRQIALKEQVQEGSSNYPNLL